MLRMAPRVNVDARTTLRHTCRLFGDLVMLAALKRLIEKIVFSGFVIRLPLRPDRPGAAILGDADRRRVRALPASR